MNNIWTDKELEVIEAYREDLETGNLGGFADKMVYQDKYDLSYDQVQKIMFFTTMLKGPKYFSWEIDKDARMIVLDILSDGGRVTEMLGGEVYFSSSKIDFEYLRDKFISYIVKDKWKKVWGGRASEIAEKFLVSNDIKLVEEY